MLGVVGCTVAGSPKGLGITDKNATFEKTGLFYFPLLVNA